MVLVLGGIFCCSDTQYNTNQTAVSTVHMPVNDYLVPFLTCTLTAAIVCLDTMLICCCLLNTIIVWDFSWSLLCYTLVSVLVLGIGIARGQYYRVLDIGCLSWYRSYPRLYPICRHLFLAVFLSIELPVWLLFDVNVNADFNTSFCSIFYFVRCHLFSELLFITFGFDVFNMLIDRMLYEVSWLVCVSMVNSYLACSTLCPRKSEPPKHFAITSGSLHGFE